jgi:nitrile hydratase
MDGIHDLGGRAGFGPVDVHEPEEQFHHEWEARALAIIRSMTHPVPWSLDWFRQVRELIEPVDYLSRPYYDQWVQSYCAMLVAAGAASVGEIAAGKAERSVTGLPPPMDAAQVHEAMRKLAYSTRPVSAPPRFAIGDSVSTIALGAEGHTRLPLYARGRTGKIVAYRGGFVLPDDNARDAGRGEHLYTVGFAAADLWPESADSRDRVHLDLWESYLEPG